MIALLKGRYVGPRVLERFDAASAEDEVQEHWSAWRKPGTGQGVFPHHPSAPCWN